MATSNATHIYTPLTHAARHIEQLELMLDELETEAAAAAPQAVAMPTAAPEGDPPLRQKSPGRRPLPEHLPRAEIVHQLGEVCPACSSPMRKVGEDVTEILDCPASAPVRQKRPVEEGRVDGPSSPVKERGWDG